MDKLPRGKKLPKLLSQTIDGDIDICIEMKKGQEGDAREEIGMGECGVRTGIGDLEGPFRIGWKRFDNWKKARTKAGNGRVNFEKGLIKTSICTQFRMNQEMRV